MKTKNNCQVIGIPVAGPIEKFLHSSSLDCSLYKHNKRYSVVNWMNKFSKKADSYAQGIRDQVTLAPKISETVKGKLSLGAKILQAGGIEKIFRRYFCVNKREKLLNAFQCHLSTTSGPIAGLLFISNENIAFTSDAAPTRNEQHTLHPNFDGVKSALLLGRWPTYLGRSSRRSRAAPDLMPPDRSIHSSTPDLSLGRSPTYQARSRSPLGRKAGGKPSREVEGRELGLTIDAAGIFRSQERSFCRLKVSEPTFIRSRENMGDLKLGR